MRIINYHPSDDGLICDGKADPSLNIQILIQIKVTKIYF